ncbi:MAG: beta/gamma crystallin-related protein [Brevundimonas sp.]|uniref:beta/gamma crystallin-related protein n=1 Tax=Brevundimonas sp. TaxID=1871086 RepID=UPI0027345BFC|nr:beta/gamma crystallin-related protein [Brevundimonas sp.]MDP3379778.1 beta/gamma crystallin-related protein [Brevundimonas sp.]
MLSLAGVAAMSALALGGSAPVADQDPQRAPGGSYQDPQRVSPRGSYTRTCSGDYVNQGRLYADCRDERGQIRGTSIELNRCGPYDIANNNGRLVCGPHRGDFEDRPGGRPGNGGGNGGGGWGGGNGRVEITVYRDANFRGASTTFTGEIPNLDRTGFNDQISSMRFRGEWEACSDAYFRGTCQRFNGDVSNLDRWGLNDRISSLRPVGRGGRR